MISTISDNSKKVKFGVFSQQQIKQMAVLELHQRDLYDISSPDRKPAVGGVLDRKLVTFSLVFIKGRPGQSRNV